MKFGPSALLALEGDALWVRLAIHMPRASEHRPSGDFDFLATLAAARAGNAEAIETLASTFYPAVQRMVHRELSLDLRRTSPWLAARFSTGDVVHEVFRSLLQDLSGFAGDSEWAFQGYLSTVVRNRLLDALRFHRRAQRDGRRTESISPELDPAVEAQGPGTRLAVIEELDRYRLALAELSEPERLILRERLERQTPFPEVAERLGYSSKWAASRAFYSAQAKLLIRLGLEDEESR